MFLAGLQLGFGASCHSLSIWQWIPFGDHPIKLERYREDWPLRKDDTHKSRSATSFGSHPRSYSLLQLTSRCLPVVTNKNNQCRLLDCSKCGNFMQLPYCWLSSINASHILESQRLNDEYFMAISAVAEPPIAIKMRFSVAITAFFPPVWPIRTRHGPYNSVSGEKHLEKGLVWSKNAGKSSHQHKQKTKKCSQNDPQIPQPDLRFAIKQTAKQQRTGPGPNKNQTKQLEICLEYSDLSHCIVIKNMQTN